MAAPANDLLRALEDLLAELPARLRGSRERAGEQTASGLRAAARELGFVLRDEVDELELRVAQLEHRLHLLESAADRHPPA